MRLTPLRPAHWPDVGVEVRRFVEHGHPVTACVVRCRDAISGESFVLPFTCVGTTLRGARGQRHPDGGWSDPFNGPTLDIEVAP